MRAKVLSLIPKSVLSENWIIKGARIIGTVTSAISITLAILILLFQFLIPPVANNYFYLFYCGILLLSVFLLKSWWSIGSSYGFQAGPHATEMYPSLQEVQLSMFLTDPNADHEEEHEEKKLGQEEPVVEQFNNLFCFSLAKEYEDNEDSFSINNIQRRYAVSDGVSTSFIPEYWANLVAKAFVQHPNTFHNDQQFDEEAFRVWLAECSRDWKNWVYDTWLPRNTLERELEGKPPRNWDVQINQNGAQTTLIGCSLSALGNQTFQCQTLAVGDAQIFHFRQAGQNQWIFAFSFPNQTPQQFGRRTAVLATRQDLWSIACNEKAFMRFTVEPKDLIVLTSDAIGKWILADKARAGEIVSQLFTQRDTDMFKSLIFTERQNGRIENDDITMMIILC